jgi:CRISPR-associated protein Csy2
MTEPSAILVLPRLRIQNANAISGPLSWGFPSPTAFTGFVHALERELTSKLENGFGGVGIICHDFSPQVSRSSGWSPYTFCLTRNPIDKKGESTSFVEEGRVHLEVSLVIGVLDYMTQRNGEYLAEDTMDIVLGMRLAGGSILPVREGKRFRAQWWPMAEDIEGQIEQFRRLRRQLLPGFALVQREDYLAGHLEELRMRYPEATALDALLDLSRINYEPDLPNPDKPGETMWGIRRKTGWVVPVPIGYAGLSPLYAPGEVENSRDDETPFRFVECLYSLGEWVSPHRVNQPRQLFWHHNADQDNGIYTCVNHYSDFLNIHGNYSGRFL